MNTETKQTDVRASVLDIITYFAVFGLPVSLERLNALLGVKASHLAVIAAVRELMNDKIIRRIGDDYGLKRRQYKNLAEQSSHRAHLLEKAKRIARWIGLLPFVKSIVVINSVAIGNVHKDSDIDLLIVTTPGRIFVAKGFIWQIMKLFRILETEEKKAGQFSLGMWLTTRGILFERDIMKVNTPHLKYLLLTAVPVYGERRWYEVLQSSLYIRSLVPNRLWPRGGPTIDRSGWRFLDDIDDRGYRIHLKHTSQQPKNQAPEAFVRIRPDIINLHALDKSEEIARKWEKLSQSIVSNKD